MLVMVLFITAVGLLFGAGALLLFRFQCQMRIDRQHELEKVYAVRSALNYIRKYTGEPSLGYFEFGYRTGSGRDLGVVVKPVETIFPNPDNEKHLDIGNKGKNNRVFNTLGEGAGQYNDALDYEYGATEGVTNVSAVICNQVDDKGAYGLAFTDLSATNNVRWWVNIGMRDTGGWLQEDYGRRYFFSPLDYVDGKEIKDVMRMCLVRNVTNASNRAGCRHGWPLSKGERALVFQIAPRAGFTQDNNAEIQFSEYVCGPGGAVVSTPILHLTNCPSLCYMGLQIAGNKVSIFQISNKGMTNVENAGGYEFSVTKELTLDTYRYFSEEVIINGRRYGGVTNVLGKLQAPELRAVFEVEAASDMRGGETAPNSSNNDFLTDFRVTPAYQYDVFLEHPHAVTNLATVAQKVGTYSRNGSTYSVLTYDTHGTEHKGFRRDERESERTGRPRR